MSRFLVCGGRDYFDHAFVNFVLNEVHEKYGITLLIHGDAKGADSLASSWAFVNGVQEARFPVTSQVWKKLGPKAGPIRNRLMLDLNPAQVVAFPGGRGTADMVQAARERGIHVDDRRG